MVQRAKNGNYTIYYSERIYLACDAPIEVPVTFDSKNSMTLVFDIKYDGGETDVSFAPSKEENGVKLIFTIRNFGTPLGSILKVPVTIGRYSGNDIKIRFGVIKPQDSLPILELTVYVEDSNE